MTVASLYNKDLLLIEEDVRQTLVHRHKWTFHDTSHEAMQSIRELGLKPHDPGVIDLELLDLVCQTVGSQGRLLLCLKPGGSLVGGSAPQEVRLALCSNDLPARLGVDWSSSATARAIKALPTKLPPIEAFLRVVEQAGSFVSYDPVSPSLLRVGLVTHPESDPGTWPYLTDVQDMITPLRGVTY